MGSKIAGMVIVRHLALKDAARAEKIDHVARWAFPLVYLTANVAMILFSLTW